MANYYCEKCGAEVKRTASRCSSCGMPFSAVKCPRCSFVGEAVMFEDGCPSCGYTNPQSSNADGKKNSPRFTGQAEKAEQKGLPGWFFWLLGGVLIALLFVFIFTLVSMV